MKKTEQIEVLRHEVSLLCEEISRLRNKLETVKECRISIDTTHHVDEACEALLRRFERGVQVRTCGDCRHYAIYKTDTAVCSAPLPLAYKDCSEVTTVKQDATDCPFWRGRGRR